MAPKPAWLNISEAVLTPLLLVTEDRPLKRPTSSTHLQMLPSVAVHHLGACAQTGMWANANGNHSVAISLMRHSVEALTVIDIALQDPAYADPLLKDWEDDKKSIGQLRAVLERDIWPRYGVGLWDEPWAEYFGKLARAVQPYAHFMRDLMGWLWSIQDFDGHNKFVIKTGWHVFDPPESITDKPIPGLDNVDFGKTITREQSIRLRQARIAANPRIGGKHRVIEALVPRQELGR